MCTHYHAMCLTTSKNIYPKTSVSVCSTNRTDYSYTSSNSYTSSMSSRRSRPYESSVTTFITTESDTSRFNKTVVLYVQV